MLTPRITPVDVGVGAVLEDDVEDDLVVVEVDVELVVELDFELVVEVDFELVVEVDFEVVVEVVFAPAAGKGKMVGSRSIETKPRGFRSCGKKSRGWTVAVE